VARSNHLQVRASVCVFLIVVMRIMNLAVPILYKKVRLTAQLTRGQVGPLAWQMLAVAPALLLQP
jgi:hypothetical protein